MDGIPFGDIAARLLIGGGAFLASALILFILWMAVVRIMEAFSERGRIRFFGKVLKELNLPVSFLILLVSVYFGVAIGDKALLSSPIFTIWAVAVLILGVNIIAKATVVIVEYYCGVSPSLRVLGSKFAFIRVLINFLLYSIAVILVVEIISPQLGFMVAIIGFLLLVFAFILFHGQLKDLIAGTQLVGGRLREGDYIEACGITGTVLEIRGRRTLVRCPEGIAAVSNSSLVSGIIMNHSVAGGGYFFRIPFCIECDGYDSARKAASDAANLISKMPGAMREHKPVAEFKGIESGHFRFSLRFIVEPGSNPSQVIEQAMLMIVNAASSAKSRIVSLG